MRGSARNTALGAAFLVACVSMAACGGGGSVQPSPRATESPAQQVRSLSLQENLEAEVVIENQPDWIASGFGSVWVTVEEAAAVDRIDPNR